MSRIADILKESEKGFGGFCIEYGAEPVGRKYCPKHKTEQLFTAEIFDINTNKTKGKVWKCDKCGKKKSYTFGEKGEYK